MTTKNSKLNTSTLTLTNMGIKLEEENLKDVRKKIKEKT